MSRCFRYWFIWGRGRIPSPNTRRGAKSDSKCERHVPLYIDYQSYVMFAKSPVKPVSYFRHFVVPLIPFMSHIIINLSFIITLQSDVTWHAAKLYSFFNLDTTWGGWLTPCSGRCTPGKENRWPLCRRLGGPQGRSGRVWKTSPPSGIRSLGRPARSVSLCRLSCPDPICLLCINIHYKNKGIIPAVRCATYCDLYVLSPRSIQH